MMFNAGDQVKHTDYNLRGKVVSKVPDSPFYYVQIKHQTWSIPEHKMFLDTAYAERLERSRVSARSKRLGDNEHQVRDGALELLCCVFHMGGIPK